MQQADLLIFLEFNSSDWIIIPNKMWYVTGGVSWFFTIHSCLYRYFYSIWAFLCRLNQICFLLQAYLLPWPQMASPYLWLLILLLCFDTLHCQYFKWTPSVNGTLNAYCAERCRDCSATPCQVDEACCVCNVKSAWEIGLESTLLLHVEYRNAFGDNTLIKPRKPFSDSMLQLIHTNGRMRAFPNNLCNFEKIVHVNLQSNSIGKIPSLSCIPYLEVLILSKNQLMEIRNTTFEDNIFLRKVDLSFNSIRVLDPNAFRRYDGSSPFSMQLSHIHIRI